MSDLSSFLSTMPTDLGKKKTARLHEIAERNKIGVYKMNNKILKFANINVLKN
jgi:hypothetical protein